MERLFKLNRIISYLPLSWILFFGTFLFRTYLKLGRLPVYDSPDPKDLKFDIQYNLLFFTMIIIAGSIFIWLPISIYAAMKGKTKVKVIDSMCYIIFYILFISFIKFDFGGLFDWFTD